MTSLYDQKRATREYAEEYAKSKREEGLKEGIKEIATKMITQGFTDDQIRSVTDYSEKDIISLRQDLSTR